MPVVRFRLEQANLAAVAQPRVKIYARGATASEPVYKDGGHVLVQPVTLTEVTSGFMDVTLDRNTDLLPTSSYFEAFVRGERKDLKLRFRVPPTGAGPFYVEDLLIEAPGEVASSALEAHAALTTEDNDAHGSKTYTDSAISDLVGSAGPALDTLGELSDALGDDANFAASVTTSLATKATTAALNTETNARIAADTAEATARASGDTAAISAASADATSKANAAQAAAESTAAADATTKADAAETDAKVYTDVHEARQDNPHVVTKAQVGLANVTNDAQETPAGAQTKATAAQTAAEATAAAALATHQADTTGIHGIADTSLLATDAEVTTAVAAEATLRTAADDALQDAIDAIPTGPFVDVTDFGAAGDGVADDTAEIQAAIDSLSATYGGTVYFPPGKYKVTSTITVTDATGNGGRGTRLVGGGGMRYRDNAGNERPGGSTIVAAASITALKFNAGAGNYAGAVMENLHVEESGLGHTSTLVSFNIQNHFTIRNCTLNGGLVGILVDAQTGDASWGLIEQCIVSDNTTNVKVTGDAGNQGTPGVTMFGGAILTRAGQTAVDIASNCHHCRIIGVKIDVAGASSAGIKVDGTALMTTIMGCNLEGTTDGDFINIGKGVASGRGTRIIGNAIAGTNSPVSGTGIHLQGGSASLVAQVVATGNHIRDVVTGIKLTYAINCTLSGNTTHNNTTGVTVAATSTTGNKLIAHGSYLDTTDVTDDSLLLTKGALSTGVVLTDHENANNTGGVVANNDCYYQRVIRGGLMNRIRITVAAQSGNVDVGVCKGPLGLSFPNVRVTSSGSTACPAVGVADLTLGAQVYAEVDLHWLAIASSSTSATFRNNGAGTSENDILKGTTARQTSAFPIPSPPAPTVCPGKRFVLVGHNV